jgi:hypothetical protein
MTLILELEWIHLLQKIWTQASYQTSILMTNSFIKLFFLKWKVWHNIGQNIHTQWCNKKICFVENDDQGFAQR